MLTTGTRWTRRVRASVKPMSRDGARVAFKQLEAIAKVEHTPGRGWYGLRRPAADMAETATNADRVVELADPRSEEGIARESRRPSRRQTALQRRFARSQSDFSHRILHSRTARGRIGEPLRRRQLPGENLRLRPFSAAPRLQEVATVPATVPKEKAPGDRWSPGARNCSNSRGLPTSGRPDSNRRRPAWEAGILPTELRPRANGAVTHAP